MTFTMPPAESLALSGTWLGSSFGGGEGRWGFALQVVAATLVVAPKGCGFVVFGVPKGLVGLEVCMWGCSGMLGGMKRLWGMPKSSDVVVKATTVWGAGLAAGCYRWCN